MARTAKSENNKQNTIAKKRQQNKTKSKYFKKSQGAKRTRKFVDKKTALFSREMSATALNPQVFGERLGRDFFDTPTETLAKALLGKILCRRTEQGETLCGRIVETEAYLGEVDPACHAYGGKRTARNAAMYASPGTAYVYFIYGMYYCFNISSKEEGACVLIRSIEPMKGQAHMRHLRNTKRKETSKALKDHELTNGPSKLCTALDITKETLNNTDMVLSNNFWIEDSSLTSLEEFTVVHTTRVGISSYGQDAAQKLYRFYILGNKNISVRDKTAENELTTSCKC